MSVQSDLDRIVESVTVETTVSPPITIAAPFAPAAPDVGGGAFDLLKPRFTFNLRKGWGDPIVIAPHGAPEPSYWPVIQLAGVVVGSLAVAGLVGLVVRRLR